MELKDCKIDTYTSSISSSVRVTHIPTGLVETCDENTTQLENRVKALERLSLRVQKWREPYLGDSGDENDFNRWEDEGGR